MIKVEFLSGLALGDSLMVTCAVRDLKKAYPEKYAIKVNTTAQHVWDYNPYLSDFDHATMTIELGPKKFIAGSQSRGLHYCNAFRESMENNLNLKIPQGPIKPDLHLSDAEKKDRIITGQYWIIVAGGKSDFGTKVWPPEYWQKVVNELPELTFVQIGETKHNHPVLTGPNVINLIGQTEHPDTGIRDLIKLFYHCEGSLGLVSMHMHLAAAFGKASVIVAGAREPASFEQYNYHRYLHNMGSFRCKNNCHNCKRLSKDKKGKKYCGESALLRDLAKDKILCTDYDPIDPAIIPIKACWKSKTQSCVRLVDAFGTQYPQCIMSIQPSEVISAVRSYYTGGALQHPDEPATINKKRVVAIPKKISAPTGKKIFRMVCNAHNYIGGEKSVCWIMRNMEKKGYHVQLVPSKRVCDTFRDNMGSNVQVTNDLTSKCDIIMVYSNDMSYEFHRTYKKLAEVKADKKVLMLNYKLGRAGKEEWTKTWDLYGFLCTQMRDEFLERVPGVNTFVLPPAVDIEPYLSENVRYSKTLHFVRHSSQGDNKFPDTINEVMDSIRKHKPRAEFSFMPPPSFLYGGPKVHQFSFNHMPVIDFLKRGNCYWYILPEKYSDQGPRTIVEAMALGLPCIADNRWGAKDRITEQTGWLCDDFEDYAQIASTLDHHILAEKGEAAKARARDCFDPNRWIEEITA